jgi:hypothetical protein
MLASEHTISFGVFNVNRNTTPSLYEKVVQHFKTKMDGADVNHLQRSTG